MAKNDRSRDSVRSRAATSRSREAADLLTVLEKLALRALPGRQVPAESGVRFAIGSAAKNDGICLVFLVDDREAPIYPDAEGLRPDYLVLHASRDACVLTIVEMKGRSGKNTEHGVDQILTFYRRLKQEMAACLPGSWRRVHIQGLLLMPENAQFNRQKIATAKEQGIEIYPLSYHHQAELYEYIKQPFSRVPKSYKQRPLPRSDPELNPLEQLLVAGKVLPRIRDARFTARRATADDTLYLNFRRPGDPASAYATLAADRTSAVLAFTPDASAVKQQVCDHIESHRLRCPALRIEGDAAPAPTTTA